MQRRIKGKTQKTAETKHKTGDKLNFSESNKKNKEIVFMFFFLLNYGFVPHVMVGLVNSKLEWT